MKNADRVGTAARKAIVPAALSPWTARERPVTRQNAKAMKPVIQNWWKARTTASASARTNLSVANRCAAYVAAATSVITSPKLTDEIPPVSIHSPIRARHDETHWTPVGGFLKNRSKNMGTKITNKPVMNPEFDADVY